MKLSIGDVAKRLNCSVDTVSRMDSLLAPERIGARNDRVYDSATVERFMTERATAPSIRHDEIRRDAIKGDALRDLQALCGEAVSARREAADGGADAAAALKTELDGYLADGRTATAQARATSVISKHMANKDSPVAARGDAARGDGGTIDMSARLDGFAGSRQHVFDDGVRGLDESTRCREAALALAKERSR